MDHEHFKVLYGTTNKQCDDIGSLLPTICVEKIVSVHGSDLSDLTMTIPTTISRPLHSLLPHGVLLCPMQLILYMVFPVHVLHKSVPLIYSVSDPMVCRVGDDLKMSILVQIYHTSIILSIRLSSPVTSSPTNVTSVM